MGYLLGYIWTHVISDTGLFCSSELRLHFGIAEVGSLISLNRAWRAQVTHAIKCSGASEKEKKLHRLLTSQSEMATLCIAPIIQMIVKIKLTLETICETNLTFRSTSTGLDHAMREQGL